MYTNDSELCCFILYPTFQELLLVRSTTQSKSSFVPGDKPGSSDSPSVILQLFSSFSLVPADWRNRVSSYRGSKRNPPCTTSNFFCLSKFVIYLCGVLLSRVETGSVRVAWSHHFSVVYRKCYGHSILMNISQYSLCAILRLAREPLV
jgi:hypothetical protein